VHGNVNKKAKRFELVRRRLGVEKKKLAGLKQKHLENVALVAAGARTGKAARRALREGRRAAKSKLVRRTRASASASNPHAAAAPAQAADGLADTHMEQAPKGVAPAKAGAAAASAMMQE